MAEIRDEFLSEEDLDLANLDEEELIAWWNEWLLMAQATNAEDELEHSHGVFQLVPYPRAEDTGRPPGPTPAPP